MTTKFKGWIEKLYVDSTGKQVHRGDPLFEIYSPELYSAQDEYLLALNQHVWRASGTQNQRAAKARSSSTSPTTKSPNWSGRRQPQRDAAH